MVYKLYPSKPAFEKTNTVCQKKALPWLCTAYNRYGVLQERDPEQPWAWPWGEPSSSSLSEGSAVEGSCGCRGQQGPHLTTCSPTPPPPTSHPSSSLSHFPHKEGGGERKRRTTEGCSPGKGLEVRRAAGTKNNEPPQA